MNHQRKAVLVSVAILAVVIIAGGVTLYLLSGDRVLTGSASPGAVTTTQTVIYDSCEDLHVPCPPPDAGSAPPSGSAEPRVDGLARDCFGGNMHSCDDLYAATANGDPPAPRPDLQPYYDYAYTCGDRLSVEEVAGRLCVDIYTSV